MPVLAIFLIALSFLESVAVRRMPKTFFGTGCLVICASTFHPILAGLLRWWRRCRSLILALAFRLGSSAAA